MLIGKGQVKYDLWKGAFNLRRVKLRDLSHHKDFCWLPEVQMYFSVSTGISVVFSRVCRYTLIKRTCLNFYNVKENEFIDYSRPLWKYGKVNSPDCSMEIYVTIHWKEYHMFCKCWHLNHAGARRCTLHHFMTIITSTHLLLSDDRVTWTPPHSTANYFLLQASCCTDSDSDAFSDSFWRIFPFDKNCIYFFK